MSSPCRISSVISNTDVTWRGLWHHHSCLMCVHGAIAITCHWCLTCQVCMPLMVVFTSRTYTSLRPLTVWWLYTGASKKLRWRGSVYISSIHVVFMCLLDGYLLMVAFTSKTYPQFYRIGGLDTFVFLLAFRLWNVIGFWHWYCHVRNSTIHQIAEKSSSDLS
jgi:hypothetical protein